MTSRCTPLARIGLPDDVARAAEAIAPQLVAQKNDRGRPGLVVLRPEATAEHRLHTKGFERLDCQLAAAEPLGTSFLVREIHRSEAVGADALEGRLPALPDRQIVDADRLPGLVLRRIRRDDGHDSIGIRERKPLEQAAVDDAEDGRAEADSETKSENSDQRQRRVLDQHPHAGTNVGE